MSSLLSSWGTEALNDSKANVAEVVFALSIPSGLALTSGSWLPASIPASSAWGIDYWKVWWMADPHFPLQKPKSVVGYLLSLTLQARSGHWLRIRQLDTPILDVSLGKMTQRSSRELRISFGSSGSISWVVQVPETTPSAQRPQCHLSGCSYDRSSAVVQSTRSPLASALFPSYQFCELLDILLQVPLQLKSLRLGFYCS